MAALAHPPVDLDRLRAVAGDGPDGADEYILVKRNYLRALWREMTELRAAASKAHEQR